LNLGTGKGHSVREVIRVVEEVTGRKVKVKESPRRPGDAPALVADPSLAVKTLGWRPKHDIHGVIESAWKWHKKLKKELLKL